MHRLVFPSFIPTSNPPRPLPFTTVPFPSLIHFILLHFHSLIIIIIIVSLSPRPLRARLPSTLGRDLPG